MKKRKEPIRILNIVPNMRAAGIETFIMNIYRNIDRENIQFDFLVHNKKKEFYDDEIEKLGGKIYRLSFKDDKNIFKYIKNLITFFKMHKEYKIVHGHMQSMMPLYLMVAKKSGVKIRIAHSHNGSYEKTIKGFILHLFSRLSKFYSTNNIACSKIAGEYLFGKKQFDIIYNGVEIEKFKFNNKIRENKKKELGIGKNLIILLHVGRFELQKNHDFLIEVFEKYNRINKNSMLLLAGEGKFEDKIREKVKEKKLDRNVKFLGVRNDINEIMQASDIFLLPSLYEGFPVVGVEAQCAGLKCLFSSNISNEIKILDDSVFIDIDNINKWVNELETCKISNRKEKIDDKFNIKKIAKDLEERYLNMLSKIQ